MTKFDAGVSYLLRRPTTCFFVIVFGAIAIRTAHFLVVGVVPAGDTLVWDPIAREWAQSGFKTFFDSDTLFLRFMDFRFAYPLFLALVYLIAGIGNHGAVVVAQILLDSLVAAGLFFVFARENRPGYGLLAGLVYICLWESFRWTAYVLTDSLFTFNLFILFVVAISGLGERVLLKGVALGFLIAWVHLTRGNAIILLIALPVFVAIRSTFRWQQVVVLFISTFGILALLYAPLVHKWNTLSPRIEFTEQGNSMDRRSLNDVLIFSTQVIQNKRIQSGLKHGETQFLSYLRKYPFDYIKLAFLKLAALYNPVADNFSWRHNLLNIVSLVPLYILALAGLGRMRKTSLVSSSALFIVCLTILQMITWIDYDQRYRAPIMPFIVILSIEGLAFAREKAKCFLTDTVR